MKERRREEAAREEERRLLKVGGKFGSAAKLTQLSSPLLKRNFASPNALHLLLLRDVRLSPLPSSFSSPSFVLLSHSSSRAVSIRHSGRLSEGGVNSVFWDYRFCYYYYFASSSSSSS